MKIFGVFLGFLLFILLLWLAPKVVLVITGIALVLSPFMTSGKGDRNYGGD